MLSRGSSSASTRLQRAKSTSSINPRQGAYHEHFSVDSEASRQQAVTAAEFAFQRAKERETANRQANKPNRTNAPETTESTSEVSRRQSIRFTGPAAIPTRSRSITRREAPTLENTLGYSEQQSDTKGLVNPHFTDGDHFVESEIPSVPSSYRKLRKAKSMFTPGRALSPGFSNGTLSGKRHVQRQFTRSSDEPLRLPDRRLRRSMSFLRGVTDRIPSNNRQYATQDAAVQLARDQYLRQLEEQRLKKQPSFLHLGKRRKSQKAFRKTVRTSSTNSYGSAVESPMQPHQAAKSNGIAHKARSVSQTLRQKLKQAFRRNGDAAMPVQHLEASRPHYGALVPGFDQVEDHYSPPSPNVELSGHIGSPGSVLRSTSVNFEDGYLGGSIRSVSSGEDLNNDKSRVTSWTNSTANTINMPQLAERKHLSVIEEDGGSHEVSSSVGPYGQIGQVYSAFRQPIKQSNPGFAPEPQRVYSALRKEIVKNSLHANLDDSDSGTESSVVRARSAQSGSTIRRLPNTSISAKKHTGNHPHNGSQGPMLVTFGPSDSEDENDPQHVKRQVLNTDYTDHHEIITPQQIAELDESELPLRRPLRESKSAFFPTNMRIEKSDTSPYRRLMRVGSEDGMASRSEYHSPSKSHLQQFGNHFRQGSVAGSESVYSQTSGRRTPMAIGSSLSLARSEEGNENGTAVIIASDTAQYGGKSYSFTRPEYASIKSSGEWKRKLASDLARLDEIGNGPDNTYSPFPGRDFGHRRENAQLDEDEVTIGIPQRPRELIMQPLGLMLSNNNARPQLKHKASDSLVEHFPFVDKEASYKPKPDCRTENVPLTRRPVQASEMSKLHIGESRSISGIEPLGVLRHKPSQLSLVPRNENTHSPASSASRHSPERMERLRRLQSKSPPLRYKTGPASNPETSVVSQHEEQMVHDSSPSDPSRKERAPESQDQGRTTPNQMASAKALVDGFLKIRPRGTRDSEDGVGGPAFL